MVALATAATAIASQAVITGAYSITRQAMQLGFLPRMEVRHTSEALAGQIYMPRVNYLLLTGVLLLVFMFRSSSELAAAYVLAVATTAWTAGMLGFIVIWKLWNWRLWATAALMVPLILIDTELRDGEHAEAVRGRLAAGPGRRHADRHHDTWRRGTRLLAQKTRRVEVPFEPLVKSLEERPPSYRARHRRVPHQRSRIRADRAACTTSSTTRCCTSTT